MYGVYVTDLSQPTSIRAIIDDVYADIPKIYSVRVE